MGKKGIVRIKILGDNSSLKRSLDEGSHSLAGLGTAATKLAGAFAGLYVLDRVKDALVNLVRAGTDEQRSMSVLAQTIEKTTGASKAQIEANEDWLASTQELSAVSDAKLRTSLGRLLASTKDLKEAQDLLNISLDIATTRHLDVETVSLAVAKAHDGNMAGLGRLGIAYKDATGKALSFNEAMQGAIATYGGSAQQAAESTAGKLERLALKLSDVKEALGMAFAPIVDMAIGPLRRVVDYVGQLATNFEKVAEKRGLLEGFRILFEKLGRDAADWLADVDWGKVGAAVTGAIQNAVESMGPLIIEASLKVGKSTVKAAAEALFQAGQQIRVSQRYKAVEEMLTLHPGISFDQAIARLKAEGPFSDLARGFTAADYLKVKIERLELGFTDVTLDEQEIKRAIENGYPADKIADLLQEQQNQINKRMITQGGKTFADMLFTPGEDLTKKYGDLIERTAGVTDSQKQLAEALSDTEEEIDPALLDVTKALSGLYDDAVDPTEAWTETIRTSTEAAEEAGRQYTIGRDTLAGFLREMQTQIANWETFETNLEKLAKEWGPEFGADVIAEAAKIGPDFVAALVGSDDPALVAQALAALKITLTQSQDDLTAGIVGISEPAGKAGGKKAWNAWQAEWYRLASKYTPSQIYGVHVPDYMAAPYADGGFVPSSRLALVGEEGPELILPLSDRERTFELLEQAGIFNRRFGHGGIVGNERSIASTVNNSTKNITINVSGNTGLDIGREIVVALAGV